MMESSSAKTISRPVIIFVVCACTRFQVTPKVSHLHAVKRIFRYLKGQLKLGLWYPRDSPFDLEAFSDSDYAGANLDRKSTIRGDRPRCQEAIGGAIAQTRSKRASKHSYDLPLLRVNTPESDEKKDTNTGFQDFVQPTPYDSLFRRVLALEQSKTA
ncbi:hypothetical protein Tco_0212375 [Tanacetum coccineum]